METRSRRFWAIYLHCLWMLFLWPCLPRSEQYTPSHGNKASTYTSQEPVETRHLNVTRLPTDNSSWNGQNGGSNNGYLSNQYLTHEPTVSPKSMQETPCPNVERVRKVGDGLILFIHTFHTCSHMWTWDLQVSSLSDGIILQFNNIYLRKSYTDKILIFTLAGETEKVEQRRFDTNPLFWRLHPLLLKVPRVLVVFDAPDFVFSGPYSQFEISYSAHPISRMPSIVEHDTSLVTSKPMYDCSGNLTVPKTFRCDMVQQCKSNEDEEGCEYTTLGCEKGWVPYKDQCLKMDLMGSFSGIFGASQPTYPTKAEETCASMYGATLALLPDDEGIRLVGNMVKQSGHSSVVVGIKKVKPVSKNLRNLYRYLWQWGDKGSPIAYEQVQLQRTGVMLNCATLDAFPNTHLQPLRCALPDELPDGYVCMRRNPTLPSVSVSRPLSAHFPPPRRALDQIPTKQCADGSLVQTFHRCQSDDVDQLSPNGFAVFHCRYGPPVHYALVCDGNSDCADGSDEMNCEPAADSSVPDDIFICDNLQMIKSSQRCNSMFDCFDESDEMDCSACALHHILCTGGVCLPYEYAEHLDVCPKTGFLGLVSSEVAAMVICLITLDRLLVLYFPFKSQFHLKGRSSLVVCGIVWVLGLSIATAPLLLNLDFYGETSICLPLPVTRQRFSGQYYAFGIFIVLNFLFFVLIGTGQIVIYYTVCNASKLAGAQRRSQEFTIARRLFLVVVTDFCCWFPIGLMGLLANRGVPIPGVVNVWAAIFILPLNSALNPFLYTLNAVLEKRRNAQLQQRTRKILGNMQSELPKMELSVAEEVVRVCIRSNTGENVMALLRDALSTASPQLVAIHKVCNILNH
ncbi:uncharacterized protein LOC143297615 [Babylonia areolata]|uniref:uncharacterized protein LOC143297615 n=1 Tax=Babylonia areolata TaxID=304850 RepID=UPI003FD62BD3